MRCSRTAFPCFTVIHFSKLYSVFYHIMTYARMPHAKATTLLRSDSSRARTGYFAGRLLTILLLLAAVMVAQDARGQGVDAVPLGDSFVFFVDSINPALFKTGSGGDDLTGVEVVVDPEDRDNRAIKFTNTMDFAYTRFFFSDGAADGMPRDMTANRAAGNVLHFRIRVDPGNPKDGAKTSIVDRYRLSVQFEDYGPNPGNAATNNNPFRLRWAIPDSMRDGEWHDVSLTLPPATWAELEAAKTAGSIPEIERNWLYAGSWAGFAIGLDLLGPNTMQVPELWTEFEWDNVGSVGIQWDWAGSGAEGKPILLDDVYIGPANLDLTGLLPAKVPPPAVNGVNFAADGNWHVVSWTHDVSVAEDADPIKTYKVYASHNPITDVKAQGVALISTINARDNNGAHTVRSSGELPHPSLGNTIYYAVTGLDANGLENVNVSNSAAALKASHSPAIVQLSYQQAAALKSNIEAGNASRSGFPEGTMPFTLNQAHSVRTLGTAEVTDSDLSASVWLGYSDEHEIYIYAEVTDDMVEVSPVDRALGDTWQDDAIELVWGNYDVRNAGGSIVGGSPHVVAAAGDDGRRRGDYPDYQIRISAHGTAAEAAVKNITDLPGGVLNPTNKLDSGAGAYAPMPGGYKILQVLPVAEFKDPSDKTPAFPGAGEIRYSPMSITINDRDGGSRDDQITWSLRAVPLGDNVWRQPHQWQTVAMVGRNVPDTPKAPVAEDPGKMKILRLGGGDLVVNLDAEFTEFGNTTWTVHHYLPDGGAAVNDPGDSFIAGSQAQIQLDADILRVTPTNPGAFKIAFQPMGSTGDEDLRPLEFQVMSSNAPMLQASAVSSGAQYNAQANGYSLVENLKIGGTASKELDLVEWFTDPDDAVLSYRLVVTDPNVVTATLSDDVKLKLVLTDQARGGDGADVWVIASDDSGEYARLRVGVSVSSATGPYVVSPLEDVIIRETDKTETHVHLFGAFADGNGGALGYEVTVSDQIQKLDNTLITPYVRVELDLVAANVRPGNDEGNIQILPRATGTATFTVKATEGGESAEDVFTVMIVSANAPVIKTQIPDQELSAEGEAAQISMADIDADKEGDQPAFEAPDNSALTYTVSSKDPDVARAAIRGGVLTLTPVYSVRNGETRVTVSATNASGETWRQSFNVTVTGATKPYLNPVAEPILTVGVMIDLNDGAWVQDLTNLTNPLDPTEMIGALFIDPNADPRDALPGGFLLRMGIEDVVADHRYDDLSTENDVVTSAMRITLDPMTGMLTITPTAPNSATITIRATDREFNEITATTKVTVMSVTSAENSELPTEVSLSQNYPNPFNPQTTIEYALPQAGDVSLIVYDMLGREVRSLLNGPQAAGRHSVRFDASGLPNGAYAYRLVAPGKTITRTMVLVK